ncbi:hypothetical protein [Sorangium sp. So ce233]|uniref:hypothetical protein n=1 Tax=Sorangium sp. So ce233 TaxID=3133290 RepID=UPI003F641C17
MLKVKTNATTNGAAMSAMPAMNTMSSAECVVARRAPHHRERADAREPRGRLVSAYERICGRRGVCRGGRDTRRRDGSGARSGEMREDTQRHARRAAWQQTARDHVSGPGGRK